MNRFSPLLMGLSLAVAGVTLSAAQETASTPPSMPKVIQITREFIKPYKNGAAHDKTESAFVQAMARAHWPSHYIGLSSMSGKLRGLYLFPYASFDAWEKDRAAIAKNAALAAEVDRASFADGELLESVDQAVGYYNEEASYRPSADLSHDRYFEVDLYRVRPGHEMEWDELVKLVKDADEKAGNDEHWAMFDLVFGTQGGSHLVLSAKKSLAEVDSSFAGQKQFYAALGEDGTKKFIELIASAVESSDHELFSISPQQSYPPEEWVKTDPGFWKPKPAASAAKAAAAPAAKAGEAEKKP